jgi:DUF4097 and DUF4098 domain-containing protein YvlB
MKKLAFLCLCLMIALCQLAAAQSRETLTLPASGCQSFHIECGAGDLKVRGDERLDRIEVNALLVVRGISESELPGFKKERVTLTLRQVGDRAELVSRIESGSWLENIFGGRDAHIDLEVRVPRRLRLAVDDGSGDTEIRSLDNGLTLDDGSGDITLEEIGGEVKIVDGSGDIFLNGLKGKLDIEDGSGDIHLDNAGSDVYVDDGSGDIAISHVLGSVKIDDGSGDIIIEGVEKDVTIGEAGSGGLSIRNVKGQVRK